MSNMIFYNSSVIYFLSKTGQLNEAGNIIACLSNRVQQSFAVSRLNMILEQAPLFVRALFSSIKFDLT